MHCAHRCVFSGRAFCEKLVISLHFSVVRLIFRLVNTEIFDALSFFSKTVKPRGILLFRYLMGQVI